MPRKNGRLVLCFFGAFSIFANSKKSLITFFHLTIPNRVSNPVRVKGGIFT
ncbi:hypothetical protein Barb4_04705 [Bacteroidales bacterium Barb4]|nr:hypothetical protein Barb4_04705 [Bacteroidales bacterium Barb4]